MPTFAPSRRRIFGSGIPMIAEPTFTERGHYEKGFAEVFEREIAPKLDEAEQRRLERVRRTKLRIVYGIGIALGVLAVLIALLLMSMRSDMQIDALFALSAIILFFIVLVVVFGPVAGFMWVRSQYRQQQSVLRDIIVGPACRFLGDLEYAREPGDRFDPQRFRDLGVIDSYTSSTVEDLFVGHHRDTGFKMVEGHFETGGQQPRPVFDGLLFEIDVPQKFSGRVLIEGDKGRVGNALAVFFKDTFGNETRVAFDHAAFEEHYEVYASDADDARRLITPGFCDAMIALAETHEKRSLAAAFVDGTFLLAIQMRGNLFEPGSIKRSLYDCEDDIHKFLGEVTIVHRVIDILHSDRPEPAA